jgi:hypothetical protein
MAAAIIPGGWYLIDVAANRFPRPGRLMPAIGEDNRFWPLSWSPDGRRLAGTLVDPDGTVKAVATYSLASGRYETLRAIGGSWMFPVWLGDSRHLLVRNTRGIWLVDSETSRVRPLISVGGYAIGLSMGVSRDNRWITYTETATEGDVWLAELK